MIMSAIAELGRLYEPGCRTLILEATAWRRRPIDEAIAGERAIAPPQDDAEATTPLLPRPAAAAAAQSLAGATPGCNDGGARRAIPI
jgi:hypothetical protein